MATQMSSGVIQQLNRTATKSIYTSKDKWKLGLLLIGLVIIIVSLIYNNILANQLTAEERTRVALWASALNQMNDPSISSSIDANVLLDIITKNKQEGKIDADMLSNIIQSNSIGAGQNMTFLLDVIKNNNTIPVILTDEKDSIVTVKNFQEFENFRDNPSYFYCKLKEMKSGYSPIVIDLSSYFSSDDIKNNSNKKQFIYYADSSLLAQLKLYPYVQFLIIGIFIMAAYIAFSIARRAEQNKVWLGMAKETAHQLGTPLSSLVGWVEYLRFQDDDKEGQFSMIADEIEKDVARLRLIADRFSKIGSEPQLEDNDIVKEVRETLNYVQRRAASRIKFDFESTAPVIQAKISPILFDWVIENLLKNALDAMEGLGQISVRVSEESGDVIIDVSDSGKGIPKSKFNTIFEPGYSTKKRGWGLGLSLSKRIIENNHNGRIFVKESLIDKGTTFRVVIPH